MPRTALQPQHPDFDGMIPTYAAANAAGHSFTARNAFIHVKNGNAAATVITLPTPGTVEGLAVADRTITVAPGTEVMFVPTAAVEDAAGAMNIDFSITASVTIAAFAV